MAQYHPLPGSTQEPTVVCTGCLGKNVHGQNNAGLPTVAYAAPIAKHIGRLVDSSNTKSVQHGSQGGSNLRSIRAGKILIAPTQRVSAPPRAYIQMGGAIAAYSLNNFFTTTLPAGMVSLSALGVDARSRAPFPIERVTKWETFIYPERDMSIQLPLLDKQEVLFDFDVDDRGFVYSAYSGFGWGYNRDSGETNTSTPLANNAWSFQETSLIFTLKVGSNYYAVTANAATSQVTAHYVYNVTSVGVIPAPDARVGSKANGILYWAKDDVNQRLAIIDGNFQLRIYDYAAFVNRSGPIVGPVSATPGSFFSDVTYDGSGSFWVVESSAGFPATQIHRYSSSGSTYVAKVFQNPYGELFKASVVSAANGFVAVGGEGGNGADLMLMRVEGSELVKVDLNNFFNDYYHGAPRGYAQPNASDTVETARIMDIQLYKHTNNKLYLIYNAGGIGDVFEIQGGNSISASMRTNSFGTVNPHARPTETGPFPGDVVKFTATSSSSQQTYRVGWEFGNPTSGLNIAESDTGADVSHQFGGYTTSAEVIAPKTVTATVTTLPSLTATVPVVLKTPVARIGRSASTSLITATSTGHEVVFGEFFTDASDGSVESHIATWTFDGVSTKFRPNQQVGVGGLGPHTMTLMASYAAYDATSMTSLAPAFVTGVGNVIYTVKPFVASVSAAKAGANAVFTGTPRYTTEKTVLNTTTWDVTWTLRNSAGAVVQTQPNPAVTLGTVPTFTVPMGSSLAGGTVTLQIAVPPTAVSGPAEYASYTATMSLDVPNPAITKTTNQCANANSPCTLTGSSATTGVSTNDWTWAWVLQKDGVTVETGNAKEFKPTITAAGNYVATLTATKGIFEGTATTSFTVASPVCGPPPSAEQVAISVRCTGGLCIPGVLVTFEADTFQYTRQACDVYTWTIPGAGTKSGRQVTHTFTGTGTFNVTLTVSNTSGSTPTNLAQAVTISPAGGGGGGGGGEQCPKPANTSIQASCGTAGNPCQTGQRVNFTALKNNGNDTLSSTCGESASWSFGDNSSDTTGRTTNHTYSNAGNFTVRMTATSPAGNASQVSLVLQVANAGCAGSATADNLTPTFRGGETNCSALNNALCRRGEVIQFDVTTFGYSFQGCDQFAWNFGDNGTANTKNPTHTYTGSAASYTATVRVYNSTNPTGVTLSMIVPFDNAPVQPQPNITLNGPRSAGKGGAVTFTATTDIPATNWRWNFGDGTGVDTSQSGVTGTSSTITHVFDRVSNAQGFNVTVTAKNAQDTTDRSTATAVAAVVVTETPVYRFLLPAVIHAGGQNGSAWRTDVQVYYSAPSPSAEPLNMTAEFNGASTPLLINQSTFIYEDFMRRLVPNGDAQGPVIITTQTKYKPQIWTRTYNVDASGRTFGQFIPAISLDETTGSSIVGSVDPSKYYLAGLRENTRYRTNLGFINPNTSEVIANVVAYDDLRLPLSQFTVTMAPFQLVQINGLSSKIANLPNRPISLEITVPAGKWLVAYASFIDGFSNDPAYIPAISDAELASNAYATGITPGVGHIGDWRSDVTIFNPDTAAVKFDLEYYDSTGLRRGQAKDIVVGSGQFKSYDDLLKVSGLWDAAPPDGLGMLRLKTTTPVTRYPLSFSRTYNDKGSGGTFGQGIPGIGATNANVKAGKAAIIPGVRNDVNYKTNIGLTNVTANPVNVVVRLLDPNTGASAREIAVELAAFQSVVGNFDFGSLQTGTFKIEITGGAGEVWAFASIINQGNDPEYVPGISIQ